MSKCRCSSGPPRGAGRAEPLLQPGRLDRVLAVLAEADDLAELGDVARLAVRGQGHHLVLVGRVQEAEVVGHLLVEDAERVRHVDLAEPFEVGCPRPRRSRSCAFSPRPSSVITAARSNGEAWKALAACARWCATKCQRNGPSRAGAPEPLARGGAGRRRRAGRGALTIEERKSGSQAASHSAGTGWALGSSGSVIVASSSGPRSRRPGRTSRRRGRRRPADPRLAQAIVDRVERQLPGRERHRALAVLDAGESLLLGRGDHRPSRTRQAAESW